jgi:hypothetical protein
MSGLAKFRTMRSYLPLALAATAFAGLLPVTVKAAAMFHPEPLALLLATLALWLCLRTLRDRRYAPALGLALGAGQLVQASLLWTAVAACLALAAARRFRSLAVVVVLAALVPAPWYVHQARTYGGNPLFPRPATAQARSGGTLTGKPKFVLARRPARFYLDPGLPDAVTAPYTPHFRNLALPTTYSELWGDYFGVWAWKSGPGGSLSGSARAELTVQALAGLLPTLLALAGWLLLLRSSLRAPPRLALALLPLLGLLGYLAFTVSYPTPDGDVLKATYTVTTAAGWAAGFAYALGRLRGRLLFGAGVALAACALADLPFLFYGSG